MEHILVNVIEHANGEKRGRDRGVWARLGFPPRVPTGTLAVVPAR